MKNKNKETLVRLEDLLYKVKVSEEKDEKLNTTSLIANH